MAGQLIDLDPEAAYQHAQAAVSRAGRVDVVREAAALTAYASGRYEEALREVRAVRRMRGDSSLRAVEADAERGLGHPEKAVEIIDATDASSLDLAEQVELVLVSSGARADLGQSDVGLVIVDDALAALPSSVDDELRRRLMESRPSVSPSSAAMTRLLRSSPLRPSLPKTPRLSTWPCTRTRMSTASVLRCAHRQRSR